MSLIRKPLAAERESAFRRAAEATIANGRMVSEVARKTGARTARGFGKGIQLWLLLAFTFGALTASSFGAKLLGLLIMSPFWYFALRKRNQPAAIAPDSVQTSSVLPRAPAPAEPTFDPDAAIARYLADRDSKRVQPADLIAAPEWPQQRPVFGRRLA